MLYEVITLDEIDAVVRMLLQAGRHGKNVRIEDDVLRNNFV